RDNIRFYAERFVRHERAEPPYTTLDLIENQQYIVAIAQATRFSEKFFVGDVDAAFTLYRFNDKSRYIFREIAFKRCDIVERRECKAVGKRCEAFFIRVICGRGKRAHRTPVKGTLTCENRVWHVRIFGFRRAPLILTSKFYRGFVRFGSGITKEDTVETGTTGEFI